MPGIREITKNLYQSEFYRNIFNLFSGMFLARLFPALFALIIVRIYTPENFGLFVLYLTIASVLSIIGTGKYENAIILAESTEQKKHLFRLSQKTNLLFNLLVLSAIFIYAVFINNFATRQILMLLLIPVYSFFIGAVQLIRHILISHKQFKTLSFLEIFRAILIGSLQCIFFILPEAGLFLGATLAQVVVFFWYARNLPETSGFRLAGFSHEEKVLMKRYIDFPKFSVASETFNFISGQLPVFLIKPFFGETMLGLYSFSHRYISVPIQLVSISISRVYVQKAQSLKSKPGELAELTFSLFKKQFLLGVIPFTVLGLWGAEIFRFLFGIEWEFSGYLAQLISPWLFMVMLFSPLSSILIVFEKQKLSMTYNVALLITRFLCLVAGAWLIKDISWAIGLYSFAGFTFFAALGIYSLKLAGVNFLKVILFIFKVVSVTFIPLILLKIWL
jgi:O-antigen/teichoic acid export membrane protein